MSQDEWKPSWPQTFEEWCLHHEEVLAFIRTVAAVISTVVVTIILARGCP